MIFQCGKVELELHKQSYFWIRDNGLEGHPSLRKFVKFVDHLKQKQFSGYKYLIKIFQITIILRLVRFVLFRAFFGHRSLAVLLTTFPATSRVRARCGVAPLAAQLRGTPSHAAVLENV